MEFAVVQYAVGVSLVHCNGSVHCNLQSKRLLKIVFIIQPNYVWLIRTHVLGRGDASINLPS